MKTSTISLTRTGFLYQDKVAVYLFLLHFRQRDLKEFYVDYPLAKQKSLDIRLITKDNIEKVYEIKSGNTLKSNEDEILDAILDLYKYNNQNSGAKLFLLVSHGFKPTISHIWDALETLRGYKILNSERSKKVAEDLFQKLNNREQVFTDSKGVHSFILRLDLDDPFSDSNTQASENDPLIEQHVLQQIDELCSVLKADSTKFEYPSDNLFQRFMLLCSTSAGNNKNMLPIFIDALIDYVSIRRLFSKHYTRPQNLEQKKGEIEKESKTDFYEWWNQQLVGGGNPSVTKTEYE